MKSRGESIVISFRRFKIDVVYLILVICVSPKNLISFYAYEVFKIIKMSCNMLTLRQR